MNVSLRIVMNHAAVDVFLPRDRALAIYTRWASRDYAVKGEQVMQGQDLYGFSYAVRVEAIDALFVMPLPKNAPEPHQLSLPTAPPGLWPGQQHNRSGI